MTALRTAELGSEFRGTAEESFAADASPGQPYLNRELSTLDFNGRVLALAENGELPLLERVKFLAIFATNMDEFFQVRVAGLMDQQAAGIGTAPDRLSVTDQLRAIRAATDVLLERRARAFVEEVRPGLAEQGGQVLRRTDLSCPHPARGGPGASFSLHLQPVAQPGRHRPRPVGW
jgi:polyphosphate kinase